MISNTSNPVSKTIGEILPLEKHKLGLLCKNLQVVEKLKLYERTKINLFKACIETILLYASET